MSRKSIAKLAAKIAAVSVYDAIMNTQEHDSLNKIAKGAAIRAATRIKVAESYTPEQVFIGAVKDAIDGGFEGIDKLDETGGRALRALALKFLGTRKPGNQFDDEYDLKLDLTNAIFKGINYVLVDAVTESDIEEGIMMLKLAVSAFEDAISGTGTF